jgi:hypothetical protein
MTLRTDPNEDRAGPTVLRRVSREKPPTWRSRLIGRPLPTADAPHETVGVAVGLAVFAGDALSSGRLRSARPLVIWLQPAWPASLSQFRSRSQSHYSLAIVTVSYLQTIHAYPGGSGAYIVARDNLGEIPAQTAGAALLMDYVLLAAVAVSSAAAQVVSAYPALLPYRVHLAIALIFLIMLANLRGVRESGTAFSIPTYFFLATAFLMLGVGFVRYLTGSLGSLVDPPDLELVSAAQPVTAFLILRAFANGTTALTGVECISNGVPAFKEPRSRNAGLAMIWMSVILGILYLGITYLLRVIGGVPSEAETVISQLARTVFDSRGLLYLSAVAGTTIILALATNTAFAGFPRLAALQAADGFLPRQLTYRGSRLVFSRGIMALGVIAALLVLAFQPATASGPSVGDRGFPVFHALPGRNGAPVVEDRPLGPGRGGAGARIDPALRARLAAQAARQWVRRLLHGRGNRHLRRYQVRTGSVDRPIPPAGPGGVLLCDPSPLPTPGAEPVPHPRRPAHGPPAPPGNPDDQRRPSGYAGRPEVRSLALGRRDGRLCFD